MATSPANRPILFGHRFSGRQLDRILRKVDPDHFDLAEIAKELPTPSPRAIRRLRKRLESRAERLLQRKEISPQRHRTLLSRLAKTDPDDLAEHLSPCHAPLETKDFYRLSDAATRRALRRGLARYARRHRLPPASAVQLWNGEMPRPRREAALLLLLPILPTVAAAWLGFVFLPLRAACLLLLTLPALFTGGYLGIAALLRKLLPVTALPLLEDGKGHTILTVCVGRAAKAERALNTIARIIASGQGEDCLLVLTRTDSSIAEEAGEEEKIAAIRRRVDELSRSTDTEIGLLVPPRRYCPRKFGKARYLGDHPLSELAVLIFRFADSKENPPEAVCILPADGISLPDSSERMAAALFHPLCRQDALVYLSPADSPLPESRLSALRQCLLQKLDAPADLTGWGLYRTDALRALAEGKLPSTRLAPQPLCVPSGAQIACYTAPIRQTPTLLPILRITLPICRALLLFGAIAADLPIRFVLLLWIAASTDLLFCALLSLRPNRRFFLYTLPAWRKIAVAFFHRTALPMASLLRLMGRESLQGRKNLQGLCVLSLFYGGAIIATGAPLSFLGVCICVAPLLMGDDPHKADLSPDAKAACHALAGELYPLLKTPVLGLPPAYLDDAGQQGPYTTPSVLGLCLAAEVAACDVGLIDPYTLERRVSHLLDQIEQLPTRCGLPYARYTLQTGEFYKDGRVNTAEAGLYALCLAAVKAGLREHAERHPSLLPLAERIAHLSAQMDFTLLFWEDGTLCRSYTPEGEREGRLSDLLGIGGPALFAALASDSARGMSGKQKIAAWYALAAPARCRGGHCLILSENGSLGDYLLTDFLLPAPEEGLIRDATRRAVRAALREGRKESRPTVSDCEEGSRKTAICLHSLTRWPRLSRSPRPIAMGIKSLRHTDGYLQQSPQTLLFCLLLRDRPHLALSHLRHLQQTDPLCGLGDPAHPGQTRSSDIALSLVALAGAITGRQISRRLASLPRFGALLPLLGRSADSAVRDEVLPAEPPSRRSAPSAPSVILLGDARNGLLTAGGRCLSLWRDGKPLTASFSAAAPFTAGRPSGILILQEGKICPLPCTVIRREAGCFTLADGGNSCRVQTAAGGWVLEWERVDSSVADLRFLLCPAVNRARLWENTVATKAGTAICLCIEYSPSLTLAAAVVGVLDPFTHADPSPFPRGSGQSAEIFAIQPRRAEGIISTPVCMIGGKLTERRFSLRLITAASRDAALTVLQETAWGASTDCRTLPLPVPDGSPASRILEWQLRALVEGASIPAAMAVGSPGSDRDLLARYLEGSRRLLAERGFPLSDAAPLPLSVNRREGVEVLITHLLSATPVDAETPLLPAAEEITYPDGFPHILRGRDHPTSAFAYHSGIATLIASPEVLRYRPNRSAPLFSLTFLLCRNGRTLLLPAAAKTVTYSPAEAVFEGEGFTLRAALLPRLPLLAIRLRTREEFPLGELTLSVSALPPPYQEEANESLHALPDGRVLFVRRLCGEGETLLLMGTFPRGRDHLYYRVRETVTAHTLPIIVEEQDRRLRAAASLLRIEGADVPPLPAIAMAVLASDSPARALLSPLCAPAEAVADLVRLAKSPPTLLLPMALALRVALTDSTDAAKLRIPIEGGHTSLYLCAARCLERAMEEDRQNPLLPPVVAALARLAERLGDHTGKELYASFEMSEDSSAARWNALPDVSPKTIDLLVKLQSGASDAASALQDALCDLPVSPPIADAALLWSGLLWGVLGFTPSPFGDGFSLAPLSVERETTVLLTYKGEWRVRLAPGEYPHCARADHPAEISSSTEQKIFRKRKISLQNSCIVHKDGVK